MIKRAVIAHPPVGAGHGTPTDVHELFEHMPAPTLDERANFYLRAVFGEREFTNDEYLDARGLLLDAMATDIVARANIHSSEGPSPVAPFSANLEHEGLIVDERTAAAEPPAQSAPHFRLRSLFSTGRFSKRVAAACAGAALATVAALGLVSGTWIAPNNRPDAARTATALPESSGRTAKGVDAALMAEAEREVATALNAVQLPADEVSALLKHGQELIAQGNLRLARLVLRQAAESGSAAAALALGRTYDPILREGSGLRSDVPPDIASARAWYQKAKDLGSAEAAHRLDQLPAAVPAPAARSDRK